MEPKEFTSPQEAFRKLKEVFRVVGSKRSHCNERQWIFQCWRQEMGKFLRRLLCYLFDHQMRFTLDGGFYCRRCGFDLTEQFRSDVEYYLAMGEEDEG